LYVYCADMLAERFRLPRIDDYGRALLAIKELRAASPSLSLAVSDGSLLARIRRISGCEPTPRVVGGGSILGAIVILIAVFAVVTWGAAPAAEKLEANEQPGKTSVAKPADAIGAPAVRSFVHQVRRTDFKQYVVFAAIEHAAGDDGSEFVFAHIIIQPFDLPLTRKI